MDYMKDVMLDIETMGLEPGCPVLAIGAVLFDPHTGQTGHRFYRKIAWADDNANGTDLNRNTVKWWLTQSDEARAELTDDTERYSLKDSLEQFNEFMPDGCVIWAKGPQFDVSIMNSAYGQAGVPLGWHYRNVQCARTIMKLGDVLGVPAPDFEGTAHNALADCLHQVEHVSRVFNKIFEGTGAIRQLERHDAIDRVLSAGEQHADGSVTVSGDDLANV